VDAAFVIKDLITDPASEPEEIIDPVELFRAQ
jgi:hypothetical protein